MRIGSNPAKVDNVLEQKYYHRVIIPVYIPELTGYFEESLEILTLCISSLLNTIHNKTAITVINNDCCKEVTNYLLSEFEKGNIDQLVINKENKGKIDPLISIIRGVYEPLITITDADVLFVPNWEQEVEKIHKNFPKAGMVAPVPNTKLNTNFATSTWIFGWLNAKIKFEKVADPEGLIKFAKSITNEPYFNEYQMSQILTVKYKNTLACIGCGHFVGTLKRGVFEYAPITPSLKKIDGGSENRYIDIPNDMGGFLRLATYNNYAYHMGNKLEPWMYDKLAKSNTNKISEFTGIDFTPKYSGYIKFIKLITSNSNIYNLKTKIFRKFFKSKYFKRTYCKKIGLDANAVSSYYS